MVIIQGLRECDQNRREPNGQENGKNQWKLDLDLYYRMYGMGLNKARYHIQVYLKYPIPYNSARNLEPLDWQFSPFSFPSSF